MISDVLTVELPFLRRYARAMTGAQVTGDAVVEQLVADQILAVKENAERKVDRVSLFFDLNKLLENQEYSSVRGNLTQKVVEKLSSLSRRAIFLTAVEGFSLPEAAQILGISQDGVMSALVEAEEALVSALATRVLIIEDEALIAAHLSQIVRQLGHSVVGTAVTRAEAVEMAQNEDFHLILSDIQLADQSSGIDAVNDILSSHNATVVFITAFPERLLTGEKLEPTFLIPKPFRPDHVKAVISQALLSRIAA